MISVRKYDSIAFEYIMYLPSTMNGTGIREDEFADPFPFFVDGTRTP